MDGHHDDDGHGHGMMGTTEGVALYKLEAVLITLIIALVGGLLPTRRQYSPTNTLDMIQPRSIPAGVEHAKEITNCNVLCDDTPLFTKLIPNANAEKNLCATIAIKMGVISS